MAEIFDALDWDIHEKTINDVVNSKDVWGINLMKAKRKIKSFINSKSTNPAQAILVRFYDSRVEYKYKDMIASDKLGDETKRVNRVDREVMIGLLYTKEDARGKSSKLNINPNLNAYYFTLEEPWRENKTNVSCIPNGTYSLYKRDYTVVPFNNDKDKYKYDYYQLFPEGYIPPEEDRAKEEDREKDELRDKLIRRTNDEKGNINYNSYGRSQILIHSSNNVRNIKGCILLGEEILSTNLRHKYSIYGKGKIENIPILETFQHTNILELYITDVFNSSIYVYPPYGNIPKCEPFYRDTDSVNIPSPSMLAAETALEDKNPLGRALDSGEALDSEEALKS